MQSNRRIYVTALFSLVTKAYILITIEANQNWLCLWSTYRLEVGNAIHDLFRYSDNMRGTGFPIPDVDYLCLLCIDFYVWDAVSIFNHLPRMFLSTDFAFRITDWTCCHGPHLHALLRIISRGVSGLATDSPCAVWGRGWTTGLLHDSPLFGSHFKMTVGM